MQDRNESTIIHPLGFFDYFINRNGFEHFHKQFFRGLDLDTFGSPVTEFNRKEESYFYEYAEESGEVVKRKVTFRNNLDSLIKNETDKYIKVINEAIKSLDYNEAKIISYLKLQIGEITMLAKSIKKSPVYLEYKLNLVLFNIIKLLSDTYPLFFSSIKSSFVIESLESLYNMKTAASNVMSLPKRTDTIMAFNWANNPLAYTLTLYTLLKTHEIIAEDSAPSDVFQKAFSGSEIHEPVKIILLRKNHNSYANIFIKVLLLLIQRGYLQEISKQEIAGIIETAFIGGNGIPFKGIYQSIYQIQDSKWPKGDVIVLKLLEELNKHFPDNTTHSHDKIPLNP
jgi:hypothetical protein